MSPELIKFIQDNKDLINQNTKESWEEIYDKLLPRIHAGNFTEILLQANIDPAKKLEHIPANYLSGSNIQNYTIPEGVKRVDSYAFTGCDKLIKVTIPNSCTIFTYGVFASGAKYDTYAFANCKKLKEIKFEGTKKQALDLGVKKKRWRENSPIEKIICTDGEVIL